MDKRGAPTKNRGRLNDSLDLSSDQEDEEGCGSRPTSASGPQGGAGGTYEDDFERGLECELSCGYEDDRIEDHLMKDVSDHEDDDDDDNDDHHWRQSGGGHYVLDHSSSYRDCDEDLENELTLGLNGNVGSTSASNPFFSFERDDQTTADGPAKSFIKFFKRGWNRTTSEPSLFHSNNKDSYYDAPDEVGYDSTPDSGVHESLQNLSPEERAKQEDDWRNELFLIEEEIQTLRSVLSAKVNRTQELKRKLGITVWREFRDDMEQGLKNVKDSDAYKSMNDKLSEFHEALSTAPLYQKTEGAIKVASEKTTTVLGTLGASVSKKIGEVKNSTTFKSFEERVGSAYTNVKTRVSNSRSSSMQSFDEEALDGRRSTGATPATTPLIPEEKPLS